MKLLFPAKGRHQNLRMETPPKKRKKKKKKKTLSIGRMLAVSERKLIDSSRD